MSETTETIVTGKKYKIRDSGVWKILSFFTKASDVECEDGNTVESKIGNIKGITTSTTQTETGYVTDATTTKTQQDLIDVINAALPYTIEIDDTAKTINFIDRTV